MLIAVDGHGAVQIAAPPCAPPGLDRLRAAAQRMAAAARWELAVLCELGLREVRLQYRGTALGLAWAVANPLAMSAVYIALFSGVMGAGGASYPRELLAALIPWSGFAAALCAAAHAPLTHAALLRGHRVPIRTLVAAAGIAALPGLLAGLALLSGWALIAGAPGTAGVAGVTGSPLALGAALLALVALELALALAIGLPLALANTLVRDTQHALHYALRVAFFVTPVVWLPDQLPARLSGIAGWIAANPMARITQAFRDVLVHGVLPDAGALVPVLAWIVALAALGLHGERRLGRRIAELL